MRAEHEADCPYCGEPLTLLVDWSEAPAVYIEDCAVCCRPMRVVLTLDPFDPDGDGSVAVEPEDE